MDEVTINLGGRSFAVRPLTLRQLQVIMPEFEKMRTGGPGDSVGSSVKILSAAMSRADPSMTIEAVMDLEATMPEVLIAVGQIGSLSGLVKPGEVKAAAPSTGEPSTGE